MHTTGSTFGTLTGALLLFLPQSASFVTVPSARPSPPRSPPLRGPGRWRAALSAGAGGGGDPCSALADARAELAWIAERSAPTLPSVAAAQEAEAMLLAMLSDYSNGIDGTVRPDRACFELVMQAYLNLGRARFLDGDGAGGNGEEVCSADKVVFLCRAMEGLWEEEGRPAELAPTIDTFNAALGACAACAGPRAARRRRLERAQPGQQQGQQQGQSSRRIDYAEMAEAVLRRMQDLSTEIFDQGGTQSAPAMIGVGPTATSYSLLAAAWARQQPMGAGGTSWAGYDRHIYPFEDGAPFAPEAVDGRCAEKAEESLRILEAMMAEWEGEEEIADDGGSAKVDALEDANTNEELPYLLAEAYDDILASWARSGVAGSSSKADDVLRRWEELADDLDEWTIDSRMWEQGAKEALDNDDREEDLSPLSVFPTSEAYTTVILSHAMSRSNIGPVKASDLLQRTLDLYEKGKWGENRPDLVAFNAVISSWGSSSDKGGAERAETLLNRLDSLRTDFEDGRYKYLYADTVSYNAAIKAWCSRVTRGRQHNATPEGENAIRRAQYLFERMEIMCTSGENPNACPDARTYTTLIYAWTRSGMGGEAADAADSLLRKMEDRYARGNAGCRPSIKAYSAVIQAHARSARGPDGAAGALALLERLEELAERGGVKWEGMQPDVVTYSTVVDAIAKSRMDGGASLAMDILDRVEELYDESADEASRPNVRLYTAAIDALANCDREEGNAQLAMDVIARMESFAAKVGGKCEDLVPNSYTYNYVIRCAANTVGDAGARKEAFRVALGAFQLLRKSCVDGGPNSFTYGYFLKACTKLLPFGDLRRDVMVRTGQECFAGGMLTDEVLVWLKRGLSLEVGRELLGDPDRYQSIRTNDLPAEWSRNTGRRARRKD